MATKDSNQDTTTLGRINGADRSPGAPLDVVFVHGLGGDGQKTWQTSAHETMPGWLQQDHPSIDVWTLTYPATATKWTNSGEGMSLPDRGVNLIPTLLSAGIGQRPTVFVCHSLGGLVVKQLLRHSAEMNMAGWTSVAERTVGVLFIATPHNGSTLATLGKAIQMARFTRTALALEAHSPHLKELGDWYRQNSIKLGIRTAAFAEGRRIRRRVRLVTVVSPSSADPGVPGCITTTVDADHFSICKPSSRDSDVYRGVVSFIGEHLHCEVEQKAVPKLEAAQVVDPPDDLLRKMAEIHSIGQMQLLDAMQVAELKMGIAKKHYGVLDD